MRNFSALVTAVAAVVAIAVILIVVIGISSRGPEPDRAPADTSALPPAPEPAAGADRTLAEPADPAPTPVPDPAPALESEPAEEPGFEDGVYEGMEEPFLPESMVGQLVAEHGAAETYRNVSAEHRRDVADYLMNRDELRENLAAILAAEEDTELRGYILESVLPYGVMETGEAEDPALANILLQEPTTEQDAYEWTRRINLARQVDEDATLELARRTFDRYPDDRAATFAASEAILSTFGRAPGKVTEGEREAAEEALYYELSREDAVRALNSDDRIRAYNALMHARSRDRTSAFLTDALEREQDPRVRAAIEELLARPEDTQ